MIKKSKNVKTFILAPSDVIVLFLSHSFAFADYDFREIDFHGLDSNRRTKVLKGANQKLSNRFFDEECPQ